MSGQLLLDTNGDHLCAVTVTACRCLEGPFSGVSGYNYSMKTKVHSREKVIETDKSVDGLKEKILKVLNIP